MELPAPPIGAPSAPIGARGGGRTRAPAALWWRRSARTHTQHWPRRRRPSEPRRPLARSSAPGSRAGVGAGAGQPEGARRRGRGPAPPRGAPPWSSQRRRLELPARRLKLEGEGGPARWLSRGGGAPPTPRSVRTHTQHWPYRRRPSARAGWLRRASPAAASRVRGPPRQCQHTRTAARASCSSPASLHIGCACCV